MSLSVGIIGLPNVGKSTIFNALTEAKVASENYPFCTIDPNHGIVQVPDKRIEQINSYIEEVFNIVSLTNKYFSDQKPWELKNNDVMRMQSVLWVTVEMIRRISIMLQPVMPESCKKLLDLLCIKDDERALSFISDEFSLIPGKAIKEPVIIFPKIEYKN